MRGCGGDTAGLGRGEGRGPGRRTGGRTGKATASASVAADGSPQRHGDAAPLHDMTATAGPARPRWLHLGAAGLGPASGGWPGPAASSVWALGHGQLRAHPTGQARGRSSYRVPFPLADAPRQSTSPCETEIRRGMAASPPGPAARSRLGMIQRVSYGHRDGQRAEDKRRRRRRGTGGRTEPLRNRGTICPATNSDFL